MATSHPSISSSFNFLSNSISSNLTYSLLYLLSLICISITFIHAQCQQPSICQASGNYTLFFDFTWTTETDNSFPSTDITGFQGIICASHNEKYVLWERGDFVSSAVASYLNETSDPKPLLTELRGKRTEGGKDGKPVFDFHQSTELAPNNGDFKLSLGVQGSNNYTKISCISKISPSPSWFIGLSSEDLCCQSKLNKSVSKPFLGWNGGIDASTQYTVQDPLPDADIEVVKILVDVAREGYGNITISAEDVASNLDNDTQPEQDQPKKQRRHSCFPANQLVMLENGNQIHLHQLKTNHRVRTASTNITTDLSSSPIFLFTHRDHNTISQFIKLSYIDKNDVHQSNKTNLSTLSLSPEHYIYRYIHNQPLRLVLANQIQIGDMLMGFDGLPRQVETISNVYERGLYNPHSMDGNLIVGGILVSCYTSSIQPKIATALLAPIRILYHLNFHKILDFLSTHIPFNILRNGMDHMIYSFL